MKPNKGGHGKISWARVFAGGLLAGVILNILVCAAWAAFLGGYWSAAMESLGQPLRQGVGCMVLLVLAYLVEEVLAVWLYAAIRPRYGSGPKTAILAGFVLWLLSGLIPTISYGSQGLFPLDLLTIDALTFLVMVVVATFVGAWVYDRQSPYWRTHGPY